MAVGDKLPVVMGKEKAAPNGVATLGEDGKLAEAQRPTYTAADVGAVQDPETDGTAGQILGLDQEGKPVWSDPPATGVTSFNGRSGAVTPQAGDYNAAQIPVSADAGAKNVAEALASKAPGGYGLGTQSKKLTSADDLNSISQNGWYCWGSDKPINAPNMNPGTGGEGYLFMRTTNYDNKNVLQEYWSLNQDAQNKARRICRNGVWGPLEWINPPMQLGVEYRTTERYNGKPVFVMAVDGGAFPDNSSKTIDVQIPDTSGRVKMLDCYGVLDNGTQIPGLLGVPVFDEANFLGLFVQNGPGKFTISVGSGRTVGLNFTLFLKYRKE